jgi:hypothetical protein
MPVKAAAVVIMPMPPHHDADRTVAMMMAMGGMDFMPVFSPVMLAIGFGLRGQKQNRGQNRGKGKQAFADTGLAFNGAHRFHGWLLGCRPNYMDGWECRDGLGRPSKRTKFARNRGNISYKYASRMKCWAARF